MSEIKLILISMPASVYWLTENQDKSDVVSFQVFVRVVDQGQLTDPSPNRQTPGYEATIGGNLEIELCLGGVDPIQHSIAAFDFFPACSQCGPEPPFYYRFEKTPPTQPCRCFYCYVDPSNPIHMYTIT